MATVNNGTEPGLQSDPLLFNSAFLEKKAWAVLVAGGSGTRLSSCLGGEPKQFYNYEGVPLYWHSARTLSHCACIKGLIFVFPAAYCEREESRIRELCNREDLGLPWRITAGGGSRSESSRNGVRLLPADCTDVFIHDAARPFLSAELVWRLYLGMKPDFGAVIPGLPLTDTVKVVDENGLVIATPARFSLRSIQTPQLFKAHILKNLYNTEDLHPEQFTDDASMLEKYGYKVALVDGDAKNVKITNPEDLELLKSGQMNDFPCTGFGYDVHRYGEGRPLILGGVRIPGSFKLVAHSDGDVLLHALTDAILGCGALGDIGSHFPDSDAAYAGMASSVFLDHALALIREQKIRLTHLDMTIVAQKPKLQPYKTEICKNIARLCSLELSQVSLKATTEEGLGFTGHLEGIKAYAVVSAMKSSVFD